jgi:hypothetical protein
MAAHVFAPLREDGMQLTVVEIERHEHGGVGAAVDVHRRRGGRIEQRAPEGGGELSA